MRGGYTFSLLFVEFIAGGLAAGGFAVGHFFFVLCFSLGGVREVCAL